MSYKAALLLCLAPLTCGQTPVEPGTAALLSEAGAAITEVDGNPSCKSLGYESGAKLDPPTEGQHVLALEGGTISIDVDEDEKTFSWNSTIGIDVVIVKGGDGANIYTYNPEGTGDSGLVSPDNHGGQVPQLSHISVCYDAEDEPDPCENVECGGATECAEAGVCNPETGECEYAPKSPGAECSSDDNPCTVDACDGAGACTHEAGNAGATCREADGACDVEEVCDGQSSECPEDGYEEAGVECLPAGHDGEVCEPLLCTGDGPDCPSDHVD